jgi:hypothetical protein
MQSNEKCERTSVDVVLTFFIHVLAVFGSMALAHYFFPGSVVWMFFLVLLGVLLIDWHKNSNPKHSVIGLLTLGAKKGHCAVQSVRQPKLIDTLPPEKP